MQTSVLDTWASLLHEGVCLVCGAVAPTRESPPGTTIEAYLHDLGWHCWRSQVLQPPHQRHVSLLRLCPTCLSDPMFVATSIARNHGQDQLEAWIRSMEFELQLETSIDN